MQSVSIVATHNLGLIINASTCVHVNCITGCKAIPAELCHYLTIGMNIMLFHQGREAY